MDGRLLVSAVSIIHEQVSSLLRDNDDWNDDPLRDTITFHVRMFDIQSNNSRLCGFYALAAAVSCCLRQDPTGSVYDECVLMNSCRQFLESDWEIDVPFTHIRMRLKETTHVKVSKLMVYCVCHAPYNGQPMIKCSICANWYHTKCIKALTDTIKAPYEEWTCHNCTDNGEENAVKVS